VRLLNERQDRPIEAREHTERNEHGEEREGRKCRGSARQGIDAPARIRGKSFPACNSRWPIPRSRRLEAWAHCCTRISVSTKERQFMRLARSPHRWETARPIAPSPNNDDLAKRAQRRHHVTLRIQGIERTKA